MATFMETWKKPCESASVLHPPQILIPFNLRGWFLHQLYSAHLHPRPLYLTLLYLPSINQPVLPSHRECLPLQTQYIRLPSSFLLSIQMVPLYSSLETHWKICLTTKTDTPEKLLNTNSADNVFYQITESMYYYPSQLEVYKMKS